MSRHSDAKKARRKKRQAARDSRWIPEPVMDELLGDRFDDEGNELEQAAATFDEWLLSRGWTFDTEFSSQTVLSWYFAPSAAEFSDEQFEPVTRIWITFSGNGDDFPERATAVLVGTGGEQGKLYTVEPEKLLHNIEPIEAYRPGDAVPDLG
ncbi:hypothetical protein OG976_16190 [Mycobacterium sp. NBC_00419]|uniref:hypothetical protein n=1 Tax=Mycobacterium sp. NBC_00419 TaxID=2975989 RepID=UPI002E1F04A3